MQVLFAISVASFLILAFAAVAMVRQVRAGHRRQRSSPRPQPESSQGFSQHLLHAVENRHLRLPQEVRFQSVKEIAANKTWNAPSKLIEIPPAHGNLLGHYVSSDFRKGPQSARPETPERLDWAYYNKDSGDLTDPYQSRPLRKQTSTRRS